VAAPGTFTLAAKQSQNIRVGSTATVGARERAFRLLIEELPQARSASAGASVAMRMRLSIPVFLEPAKGEARLDLGVPTMTKLLPAVMASNTGSVHLQIDSVKFRGVSASGREAFAMSEGGGYVLPGKSVRLTLPAPLTSAQCRDTARLFVEVAVHGDVVTHDAPVTSAACGG
jgi:fimbrial chaperone protein